MSHILKKKFPSKYDDVIIIFTNLDLTNIDNYSIIYIDSSFLFCKKQHLEH